MTNANVGLHNSESIDKQLAYLYARRSAVENLIDSLERYAAWLAKSGEVEERKRA
jgi:hypothetical protein